MRSTEFRSFESAATAGGDTHRYEQLDDLSPVQEGGVRIDGGRHQEPSALLWTLLGGEDTKIRARPRKTTFGRRESCRQINRSHVAYSHSV
jgi:hypothetical protein